MRQDIRVQVRELTVIESGAYPDQFLRPYVSELNGGLIDSLEERFHKAKRFTPSILGGIANQFMIPDHRPRGLVEIPNGWDERRGRFVLELDIKLGTGDTIRQVVLGYTNSVGFTTKTIDHDMEFYVNSTFLLTPRTMRDRNGSYEILVPVHVNDVLSDRDNAGLRGRGDKLYTMRPEDVYSALDSESTAELVDDFTDLRTTLTKLSIKSDSSNRLSSRYMSRLLSSRQKALENSEYGSSVIDLNATGMGYTQESYTSDDVFLREISNLRGITGTVDNFTFSDLLDLDPDAEKYSKPYLLDDFARSTSRYDDVSTQLDGQEEYDRIAALIAIAVPALMMETCINKIHVQAHNQEFSNSRDGSDFTVLVHGPGSFMKNVDMEPFVEQFKSRLVDELLVAITNDGMYDIGIDLKCRSFGEVDFTLYWDGSNRGRYVIPVFCNSLSSPIVTDNRKDLKKISNDFSDLFDRFLPSGLAGGGYNKTGRDYGY